MATTTRPAGADAAAPHLVWSALSPPNSPPPLAYAASAYDSDNHTVIMFGGVTPSGAPSNSTWVWDGSTWRGYAGSQIVAPPARAMASMAFDPALHQLLLFGGRAADGETLGDTWAWNGASWYQVGQRLTAPSPSPREGAAMGYDGHGDLVLFGGDAPSSSSAGGAGTDRVGVGSGSSGQPSAGGPGGAGDTGNTTSPPAPLADTWLWTADGWVQSQAGGPGARTGASLAFDAENGTAVLFGGSSAPIGPAPQGDLSDTWTWNGSSWSAPTVGPNSPAPRAGAILVDDPLAGGLVLFAGTGPGGFLSDTWIWDGQTWSAATTSGTPSPRSGSAGAYVSLAHQLLVFGGQGAVHGGNHGNGTKPLGGTSILTSTAPVALGTVLTPAGGDASGSTTSVPYAGLPQTSVRPADQVGKGGTSRIAGRRAASVTAAPKDALRRGDPVTLSGAGFSPESPVTITFHSTPTVVGRTVSDRNGAFTITVSVPQSARPGTHRFVATGDGPKGPEQLTIAAVEVVGATSSPSNPSPTVRLALVGLAFALPLASWLLMGASGRFRRRQA